jgi:hypothetical protein
MSGEGQNSLGIGEKTAAAPPMRLRGAKTSAISLKSQCTLEAQFSEFGTRSAFVNLCVFGLQPEAYPRGKIATRAALKSSA